MLATAERCVIWLYEVYIISPYIAVLQGIDVLAGVEAVISHLVVKEFQIPCAHAPALSPLPLTQFLSPKSAAEEVCKLITELTASEI